MEMKVQLSTWPSVTSHQQREESGSGVPLLLTLRRSLSFPLKFFLAGVGVRLKYFSEVLAGVEPLLKFSVFPSCPFPGISS